jgi:hypothetical protein
MFKTMMFESFILRNTQVRMIVDRVDKQHSLGETAIQQSMIIGYSYSTNHKKANDQNYNETVLQEC